jgi:hypothetical protein
MRSTWLVLGGFALLAPIMASAQGVPAGPAEPGPVVGAFQAVDRETPAVEEARAAIQKYFASLRLDQVQEAYQQIVAGVNFKLVCRVQGDGGQALWEFVVWRRLDDRWELTSARRL